MIFFIISNGGGDLLDLILKMKQSIKQNKKGRIKIQRRYFTH